MNPPTFVQRLLQRVEDETRVVAHLRGRGDVAMSTDAIMALIRDD